MKKGVDYIGVGVGIVLFDDEGKVFLSKRGPLRQSASEASKRARNEVGKWEFPGGAVEFGDTLEDTIIREMKEEFDVDVEIIGLLGVENHIIPDEKQHWVAPTFLGKIISGIPTIQEPQKIEELGWFTLADVGALDLSIVTQLNFKRLRKKL